MDHLSTLSTLLILIILSYIHHCCHLTHHIAIVASYCPTLFFRTAANHLYSDFGGCQSRMCQIYFTHLLIHSFSHSFMWFLQPLSYSILLYWLGVCQSCHPFYSLLHCVHIICFFTQPSTVFSVISYLHLPVPSCCPLFARIQTPSSIKTLENRLWQITSIYMPFYMCSKFVQNSLKQPYWNNTIQI